MWDNTKKTQKFFGGENQEAGDRTKGIEPLEQYARQVGVGSRISVSTCTESGDYSVCVG